MRAVEIIDAAHGAAVEFLRLDHALATGDFEAAEQHDVNANLLMYAAIRAGGSESLDCAEACHLEHGDGVSTGYVHAKGIEALAIKRMLGAAK